MTIKGWEKVDELVKEAMVTDEARNKYLIPIYPQKGDREKFIRKCLTKQKTRRMLNRAQWYSEIADAMEEVKPRKTALKIIFLMSLAEGVSTLKIGKKESKSLGSFKTIKKFFEYISDDDKQRLIKNIKNLSSSSSSKNLRFSSIIRLLYDIRNKAVHGEDYFSFSLEAGMITSVKTGKKNKRHKVINTSLAYKELRDIFRRTAIANIEAIFQRK
jgi:hypothetical protein